MQKRFAVIIPNYNGAATVGKCLEAVLSSNHESFEVIVVDDCSNDDSVSIISRYPCRLIRLEEHSGAATARNIGARESKGEMLFFTDSDCLLKPETLSMADAAVTGREDTVFGGTYTEVPHDKDFFSAFQSAFINYSETKKKEPDYIASHAMVISRELFINSGGFPGDFLPVIEDVEFSHRLRRAGIKLEMAPDILVEHIFRFSFRKSLANAFRKSKYWTVYSLGNRDLLSDSGTASSELKINMGSWFLSVALGLLSLFLKEGAFLLPIPLFLVVDTLVNRNLLYSFFSAGGAVFFAKAVLYYMLVYPFAVVSGSSAGMLEYLVSPSLRRKMTKQGLRAEFRS